ncbi:shikimate 5-dehydrogenase [Enterococcus sp. 10A9_DIV0425]|uniref:Shikimate dehydrogenase (NADP(+)) n=1 Tax=Candidatus Enterococcus wittei TaxID=1987383 RepID=A0A2C9XQV9_9ENTE|nr:shikimate dehydrogenase [Enterococcus sp. 10A9_DIV0425]OTP11804.1 shikimate 5-dehydrogenase [Enterococcus sp. 10A9_DIV0425]
MISGKTKLAGIFASPVTHSLSPKMHNTAFAKCGIDAVYLAFDVDQKNLLKAVEGIRTFHMLGVNLSMPNKTAVIPYLDGLSKEAELIGAVNTVVNQDNRLIGYNTDGMGFMRSVEEAGLTVKNKKLMVLGAGGAAKAIVVQAALDGGREVVIYKRKNDTFASVQAYFKNVAEQTNCSIHVYDYEDEVQMRKDSQSSDILVNATDIGMGNKKELTPIDKAMLHEKLVIFDLIYSPQETQLLKEARANGCESQNGLGMLLYQGAIAFELWTGQEMPVCEIRGMIDGSSTH